MNEIVKTYVEKVYSGFYNAVIIEEVESRDITKIKNDGLILGFFYYDRLFTVDGERMIYKKDFNHSKFIYFGERLSLEDLKTRCINDPKYGSLDSLIKRMEEEKIEFACYTNGGSILTMSEGEMTYDEAIAKENEKLKRLSKKTINN